MIDLRGEWLRLESEGASADHIRVNPVAKVGAGTVFVGIDGRGVKHLLVPAADGENVPCDRRSRGVLLVPQELRNDEGVQLYADLVCCDPDMEDVFVRLAEDVAAKVAETTEQGPSVVRRVLDEWRGLLARGATLGDAGALGLFGELEILRALIPHVGPDLVDLWTGPSGGARDFEAETFVIEVKTSKSREGRRFEVHGLEQLEIPPAGTLLVAWVGVRDDPDGITLHDQVELAIRAGAPRHLLLTKLAEAGYSHSIPSPDYQRWYIREVLVYEVSPGFPAITADCFVGGVPKGVSGVRYTVDLDAAGEPKGFDFLLASVGGTRQ